MRKVNPNRVHLSTELSVDPSGNSNMSVGAEYILKQSKVHLSLDSSLTARSLVEATVGPGVQLQLSAEAGHLKNSYSFGYGVAMG